MHELFVLALSLVWFAGATPDSSYVHTACVSEDGLLEEWATKGKAQDPLLPLALRPCSIPALTTFTSLFPFSPLRTPPCPGDLLHRHPCFFQRVPDCASNRSPARFCHMTFSDVFGLSLRRLRWECPPQKLKYVFLCVYKDICCGVIIWAKFGQLEGVFIWAKLLLWLTCV